WVFRNFTGKHVAESKPTLRDTNCESYKEVPLVVVSNTVFLLKLRMLENHQMGDFGLLKSVCFRVLILFVFGSPLVLAQPGFLSIACGATRNSTDGNNITWVSDAHYIDVGRTAQNLNASTLPFELQSVRFFPGLQLKSCYRLPIAPNATHLLRLTFFSGNQSLIPNTQTFYVSLEATGALFTITVDFADDRVNRASELIFTSSSEFINVCLTREDKSQVPFISAIELRKFRRGMYNRIQKGNVFLLHKRYDFGGTSLTRYPQDPYDRIWFPVPSDKHITKISTLASISDEQTEAFPPSGVMRTAWFTNATQLGLTLHSYDNTDLPEKSLIFFYFAEIERINASDSRIFDITANGMNISSRVNVLELTHGAYDTSKEISQEFKDLNSFKVELRKSEDSTLGPIINAMEHYVVYPTDPETLAGNVEALSEIQTVFGIRNWISDPCYPIELEGVTCSDQFISPVNVTGIHLSGWNLHGSIPPSFGKLTALINLSLDHNHLNHSLPNLSTLTHLERLHLQNNNLSGNIPTWLSGLKKLKELDLTNNKFSGDIPRELIRENLTFRYNNNPLLKIPKIRNSYERRRLVIGLIVASVIAITVALILITEYRKKILKETKMSGKARGSSTKINLKSFEEREYSLVEVPNPTKSRAFTLDEMITATQNFTQTIGKGGFGSVYYGKLSDGKEAAVKVLSLFSKQGVQEFLNEVDLLSRVNHRNLVTLLGYCNESRELMLIYEYMARGTLKDHIHGSEADHVKLDWRMRLQIVLDAAQGLEYLHVKCTPKIIHRDVKTANILLGNDLSGKLADFGLSRTTVDGGASHVTTTVKGTAGYLDPEYFNTHMLTEKSDVYSFGVVLFEIICGRQPINVWLPEEEINLTRWATPYLEDEDPNKLLEIVDNRLVSKYAIKSLSMVAKLAIRCVQPDPALRPTITQI
ncbi:hypothetical protein KI387_006764, partial [Taxus chinensis]